MGVAGVTDVLTLAHDPMRMSTADVLLDHFTSSRTGKCAEARKMDQRARWSRRPPALYKRPVDETLRALPEYLSHPDVVAVGEIGLERCTDVEERVFARSLRSSTILKSSIRRGAGRERRSSESLLSLTTLGQGVVIDHIDLSTIDIALEAGRMSALPSSQEKHRCKMRWN